MLVLCVAELAAIGVFVVVGSMSLGLLFFWWYLDRPKIHSLEDTPVSSPAE